MEVSRENMKITAKKREANRLRLICGVVHFMGL